MRDEGMKVEGWKLRNERKNQAHKWMKVFRNGPVLAGGGKTKRELSGGAVSSSLSGLERQWFMDLNKRWRREKGERYCRK